MNKKECHHDKLEVGWYLTDPPLKRCLDCGGYFTQEKLAELKEERRMTGYRKEKVLVSKIGEPNDYLDLPVVRDGKAVGTITDVVEIRDKGYELTLTMFVGLETINSKPSAIHLY